jgi:uncharacterized protein YdeI (YjbR/CyaY-like superfamily)
MARLEDAERVVAETATQWRTWLRSNHAKSAGAWLVSWKKHTQRPAMSYDEAVTEALAFGWVDSLPRKLDDDRSMLYFAPRKPGSGWSAPNKQRIERLEAADRMAPAGQRIVEAARADGSWTKLDAVEALEVPDDLATALAARPPARKEFDAFPRSARRGILEWIAQAKRPQTRADRVSQTAQLAQRGERANQWPRSPA